MSQVDKGMEEHADQAWRELREALADGMEALGPGESLVVSLDADPADGRSAPYVEARRRKRVVVLSVAGNRSLSERHRLRKPARRRLRELGLDKPTPRRPDYTARLPLSHVDQAASIAVTALRDVFGVIHPAFLEGRDVGWLPDVAAGPVERLPGPAVAVMPTDHDHLTRLIDDALGEQIGHPPHRDSDGDVPILAGTSVVFVRHHPGSPLIHVFAEMAVEVTDLIAAEHEVADLNREVPGVKFALHDDKVVASLDVVAMPFVGQHLQILVARLCHVVTKRDAQLARRVHGRVFLHADASTEDEPAVGAGVPGSDEAEDDVHPVMLALLELDAEEPGALRPKIAAELCGRDPDLLLELIEWNTEQASAWREARDHAYASEDFAEAALCEHERAHAKRTVKVLRKALKRVLR